MARGRTGSKRGSLLLEAKLYELGLTQADLSKRIGVSTGAVSRWLSGDRRPTLALAFRMESELGIPAELWIRTGTDG